MYPMDEFQKFDIGPDPYAGVKANLRLDDLEPRCEVTPKLSIMMSVFHRYSQLERTLETLCRQTFKDFEVLIYINNDDQDITDVIFKFQKFLEIHFLPSNSNERHFDPSFAFNRLFPYARGEVVAIMQPECMLREDATRWLYWGHKAPGFISANSNFYTIKNALESPVTTWDAETCVTLKTLWSSPRMQRILDSVDWHSRFENIYTLPEFWTEGCGLAAFSNSKWAYEFKIQIWWLVFSFKRTASVWKDLPDLYGHAAIDFFLIRYREAKGYIDIMPLEPMAFHQDHHRMSISPTGEQDELTLEKIKERYCK